MAGNSQKELKLILSAYDKGFKASLSAARTGLNKTGTEAGKSQKKFKSLRSETARLTGHLKNLVGAYIGMRAIGGVVGMISDFNTEMAKTSTMADTSTAAWGGLSEKIIEISTRVPQTAAELAAAEYDILSANVALEDSARVLELSAKAAVAGITDTKTAAKVGTSVINAYGLDIDKLGGVYDDLFTTVKLGKTEFPELAAAIGKVLPTARSANVDLKELGAHLATLTQGGLSTAESTTALRGAMIGLQTPTDAAKKKMAELGIEWNGLTGTIKQIVDLNLGAAVMREIIPETEARNAVLTLSQNFGKLEENLNKMKNTAGAAEAAYTKMAVTLESEFQLIKNALAAAVIDNDKFKKSLDNLLKKVSESKEGLAALVTILIDLSEKLVNGAASIGIFIDATNELLEQATLQIGIHGQQAEAMGKLEAKMGAVNEATGLQITTSKELVELVSAGVIVFDELQGKVLVNAQNLKLYNEGLLLVGTSVNLAAGSQAALWKKAAKTNEVLVEQKSDMAAVGAEIAKLVTDESQLIGTEGKLQGKLKTSVDKLKAAALAWKKVGDYAKETRKKLGLAGDKAVEAGNKGKKGAEVSEDGWKSLETQVEQTADKLKEEIAGISSEISAAKKELTGLERWREQTKRTEFNASASSIVDSVKNADPFTIQKVIAQQNDIINSQSKWLGTDDKAEARWIIDKLQLAMTGVDWRDEENTLALDANTKAINGFYDILKVYDTQMPGFAPGGFVPGSGSGDTVPAWLTPGEFVIKESIVSALGADYFAALNGGISIPQINLPVQKFAAGGMVQDAAKTINLNFNIGGKQAVGAFEESSAAVLIAELERQQMVAL